MTATLRWLLSSSACRNSSPVADTAKLNKVGFNHVCFAVDDLEAEVAKLTAAGVKVRNHMMDFHDRKLVFVYGPEDVTVELAQWH
jgi:catechol 2,3-dioxygenase-like lactoylglutathione lyase family enzyme